MSENSQTALDVWITAALARLAAHWRLSFLLAVAALLAWGFVALWGHWRQERLARGYEMLVAAADTDALAGVAVEFAGSSIGEQAELALGKKLFEEGHYERAASRYELFQKDFPASAAMPEAALGEAYAREALKQYLKAETVFVRLAGGPLLAGGRKAEAYLGAARCARADGRLKEAAQHAKHAAAQGGDSSWHTAALELLGALENAALSPAPPPLTAPVSAPTPAAAAGAAVVPAP